jgi:hypothetical protein
LRYRIYLSAGLLILLLTAFVLSQGCKKAEAKDDQKAEQTAATSAGMPSQGDNPVDFFIGLEDRLNENSLKSIAIIEITDPKENDEHRIRNVRQATMEQLSQMVDIAVREVSERKVASVMQDLKGTASTGLDPQDVMDIGIKLGVDALLFASIESKQNDVFFWAYSTMSGDLIFSDTLQKWALPVGGGLGSLLDFDFSLEDEPAGSPASTEETSTE